MRKELALEGPDCSMCASNNEDDINKKDIFSLILGGIIFVAGLILRLPEGWELGLFLAAYLILGGEVLLSAARNIIKGRVFDENFLMSIATIGAFAIGEYPEGVAVMLFYKIGELFQSISVNRSRRSISELMDIRPDYANLMAGDDIIRVSPDRVKVGDMIVVKAGEKIPLDGRIQKGEASLDTSALTGEAMPRDVNAGSEVLSGSVNLNGMLYIEVTKEFGESTVSKILDLVQNAGNKKAPAENFISKFARVYTPIVVLAAVALALIPPLVVPGADFDEWISRALVFLVVSCPCALVVSIPLTVFGGIGGASRNGILIKGGNYLDALAGVDTVVFDKTGTLTKGVFTVSRIIPADGWTENRLLSLAAYAESCSTHPIALSIQTAYGKEIDTKRIFGQEEIAGKGIKTVIDGVEVLAGSARMMQEQGLEIPVAESEGSVVYFAADGKYSGCIIIEDEIKPDACKAARELRNQGIQKLVMVTGDRAAVAKDVASKIGLDMVYADLLPHQKVEKLEEIIATKSGKGRLAFVGDGINDAPVLARADIGIAMGGLGSDAAIEAADMVLMNDEPSALVTAIRIAKKTRRVVWQNIVFALGVKAVILVLGAVGMATMWQAVFGDVGVMVIAVLNAIRTMTIKK
ncbi:MAG: heavy metal translocating P-type ATPase [Oscillospiraceae bacterium]|nr:heavy metal translocating P-type ATPase [Oscillospiraceae bacterium]MDD4414514.1 heavy metal translocating P-type ATPase [Oscillospiraceae bacterium]